MPQNFLCPQRDQPLLLPVDMREWLPEDDLVFVVLDAVATLDLGEFRRRYRADGHGRAASGPEMMVALLGLPRVFRTPELVLFHAASCWFRYSSRASCGVRYPIAE